MYLKRLEIQGFKSFPEKIRLEFNTGITAVVGPNGSGKSNISDAVRWVLGEQSAKSLRGAKMEDIIFAGTSNRRPLGFAEVSLVMDNSSKMISLEYSEITVTRRVYRSGESEYLINGTICRLKDVHELFMDTGIGREGYSIIGQGRIDEILSTKSEDRRLLFEEAAGIGKYKNRRHETNLRLEREKQNLIRVNDIIDELEKQIEPLKAQSEKARVYLRLIDRLKLLHINIFLNEVDEFEKELAIIKEKISIIQHQITDETKATEHCKNELILEKENLQKIEQKIQTRNSELTAAGTDLQNKQNDIKLVEQQIENVSFNNDRIAAGIQQKNISIQNNVANKDIQVTRRSSLQMELMSVKNIFYEKQTAFEKLTAKLSDNESMIEKYNTDIVENMKNTSEISNNLNRTKFINEQLEKRKADLIYETDFAESQIHDKNVRLQVLENDYQKLIAQANQYEELLKNYNIEHLQVQSDISAYQQEEWKISQKIADRSSKYKILSELEEGYEGYFKSVKSILKKRKTDAQMFKGIHGSVGELITVPEKYEIAIEIALGNMVQNIVTDNEESAKIAIDYLKKTKEGRATFLPMSAIREKSVGNIKEKILSEKGVIGFAQDLIKFDSHYENIMSGLLGKVVIINDFENAITFSKKYNYTYKVVTLEGELLNIGGSLTGGSNAKNSNNIFSRGREVKELKLEIDVLKENYTSAVQQLAKRKEEETNLLEKIESVGIDAQEIKLDVSNLNHVIEQQKNSIAELSNKNQELTNEHEELLQQIQIVEDEIVNHNLKLKALLIEAETIRNSLEKYQSSIQEDKEIKENQIKQLTDLRISITEIEQNIKSADENISRIENEIELSKEEINKLQLEIEKNESEIKENHTKIKDIQRQIQDLVQKMNDLQMSLSKLIENKAKSQEQIQVLEKTILEKTDTLSILKNDLVRVEAQKEQAEENNRRKYDYIWDEYEITYQSAKKMERLEISTNEMQREEKAVKVQIKELGSINVSAIEEYKQVKERYEFLTAQRDDILEAEIKLNEIIQELTKLMEEQFISQFKIISENFNVVFSEMFGGGRANLILSEETNVLESGIEIVAEPPGKTLKSMLLLSGGERALTAIALLFAILKMKPSPFCILDEIEAALDDSNVNRYANYLKNFSDNTQFIIITHRKGTMEAADVIYGVTMQEQGVSKLVSVSFLEDNL